MHVAMIGSGYVGLVSGACFADFGHTVVCVDKDANRIDQLQSGEIPIFEPGLNDLVATNTEAGRLTFTTDLALAVSSAEVVFIAVGTPSRHGDGHADLSFVYAAAKEIAASLEGYTVIATKSTVPVGTGDEIETLVRDARPDGRFSVVSNPEFLREGAAINDFKRPDRVIIGANDQKAQDVMSMLYRPLNLNQPPLVNMSRRGAELTKYAANAFLATKITFINEIADLCEKVGANVQEIARAIGMDNRIGSKFLHAGPGYGGSCFPKDTVALIRTAQEAGTPLRIVEAVAETNKQRKLGLAQRIEDACGGSVDKKTIALLGLAFKPNTDDMRAAPALEIVHGLEARGARIRAHDPASMHVAKPLLPNVDFLDNPYNCCEGADALVIVTEWDAYRALDLQRLKSLLADPVVVDLRNIYHPEEMEQHGFRYFGIGQAKTANP